MVCRCSSPAEHAQREADNVRYAAQASEKSLKEKVTRLEKELAALTPNPRDYAVEEVEAVGKNLVMRVKFPACEHAGYSGAKVLVFANVTPLDALKWKGIDPHFTGRPAKPGISPDPAARFPASASGWTNAIHFARTLNEGVK